MGVVSHQRGERCFYRSIDGAVYDAVIASVEGGSVYGLDVYVPSCKSSVRLTCVRREDGMFHILYRRRPPGC